MDYATLDFETEGIANRPHYPPKPVGIAITLPGSQPRYYAWGHPEGNNVNEEHARAVVLSTVKQFPAIWHNMKFDLEVLEKWAGYMPPPEMCHDTMLLAFLDNPHSDTLALKPLGEKLLGMPPEERDVVRDWILSNVPEARRKPSSWGAYICLAPGDLVGEYAKGDVERTKRLFDVLHPRIIVNGMEDAYLRERKLIPIMIKNEQQGIKCDVEHLEIHAKDCQEDFEKTDRWIQTYLNSPGLNLDENDSLADALEREGKITEWILTEKGTRSTAKPALAKTLKDKLLYSALMYRGSMATCLRTFMLPWIDLANSNNGMLYTTWNTTRQEDKGGTRTGRLSSSKPLNLQNIPNDFEEKLGELFEQTGMYAELDVGELPNMRSYIIADSPDHVLVDYDLSSQEPRTFAHVEGGWLRAKYNINPRMDVYVELVTAVKERTGIQITRKYAKSIFLGILFGMGAAKLATQLEISENEARTVKDALLKAVPTIREVTKLITSELDSGGYIRTWGGRQYYCEPPKLANGRVMTFSYKGVNIYCQGSAADQIKEALLRYDAQRVNSRLVATVHDEVLISCPKEGWRDEAKILKGCLESLELDVPMLAEGEMGYRWGCLSPIVK